MPIFRSTSEILNNPWIDTANDYAELDGSEAPPNHTWDYSNKLTIDAIDAWEQLYFQMGNIGVYAAQRPFVEFYIITHNLFLNDRTTIEVFYGATAGEQVRDRARELGIDLSVQKIWVDDPNTHLYQPLAPL